MIESILNRLKDKRTGQVEHYDLWSQAGEAVRDGKSSAWEKYPRPQMASVSRYSYSIQRKPLNICTIIRLSLHILYLMKAGDSSRVIICTIM